MSRNLPLKNLEDRVQDAVRHFWITRGSQSRGQATRGVDDQGARGAVAGGKQMDGFVEIVRDALVESGIPDEEIFLDSRLELPGYFRPEKQWDVIVVSEGRLVAAVEIVEVWKVGWRRAEDTDVREMAEVVEKLDATRAAFVELDPPAQAWEFHQAMAYAMDSGIELCLAFVARADEDVIADKRTAVSVYSKEAAETSKTLRQVYARWMVD